MKFEDLSVYDLDLIRSLAVKLFTERFQPSRYEAIAESTLNCINAKGYNINTNLELIIGLYDDYMNPAFYYKDVTFRDLTSKEIVESFFRFMEDRKVEITKDSTREPTWSRIDHGIKKEVKCKI